MRLLRSMVVSTAITLLTLPALAACGGDSGADGGSDGSSQGGSAEPADTGGQEAGSASVDFADCSAITAEEMAPALGEGTGVVQPSLGSGGCNYGLDDPTLPSVFIEQFPTSDFADGWDGAKANIANTPLGTIEGTQTDLADVGDGAKVVVGPSVSGGESLMSIGLVLVGDTIVRGTVLQAADLDDAALLQVATDILTVIASKA